MRDVALALRVFEQHELAGQHAALLAVTSSDLDDSTQADHELATGRHVIGLRSAGRQRQDHGVLRVADAGRRQVRFRAGTIERRQLDGLVREMRVAIGAGVEAIETQLSRGGCAHGGLVRVCGEECRGAESDEETQSGDACGALHVNVHDIPLCYWCVSISRQHASRQNSGCGVRGADESVRMWRQARC
jgi:hypothetical protein